MRNAEAAGDNQKVRQYAAELYQNLFSKFDKHLKNISTLYIAPDSFLNLLAFSRLMPSEGQYLAQKLELRQIQTGRDLLRERPRKNTGSLLALGGVDFNNFPDRKGKGDKVADNFLLAYADTTRATGRLLPFNPLPESRKKVDKIAKLFTQCRNSNYKILTKKDANETALKSLETPPAILHLSTHGFYLSKRESERPMILSGLALAGANQGIKGKTGKDSEDGILFAMEVLGLNLKGTELVSLSACDTAKGDIDYSEGVYGLVRAFRIAGAKSVLMTLWSVSDSDARKFMTKFYKNWLQQPEGTSDPAKALHETRLSYIRKKADPKIWAPYVLVGK
ncbi:CHAT domain-containing protein [Desulfonema ishimotonii]|uniref:CHAT domain-containing protein n=1 Tax=Desulfonema ishimotonii TaxID=45657 RepID=A0A401G3U5_9BACT|nr:CHAT domain-containing protein [Desulfonema ishimotonii]GBC63785.1 CHAT domain-containing protein [Desulfonema ishimotonii]